MASGSTTESRRGLPVLVGVVVLLLAAGAWVSWLGTRGGGSPMAEPVGEAPQPAGPVVRIELPHPDLALPPGPHRERFTVACTVCHSPRLAFTQPGFPEKKWAEIVHKMVAVYGAPITASEEGEIVSYLGTVHGK
jgi:hypothetical protein